MERHNKEIENQNNVNKIDEVTENSNNEIKIQQFNMNQDNAEIYVDRGMIYLEDKNIQKATEFFDMALDIAPKLVTAHLGKFLANYNVTSLNYLRNYAISDLENSKDFMRALKFSEGEDKAFLQEFFDNNKKNIENLEKELAERMQKIQELCQAWEQNYKNMQEENYKIAQQLFNDTKGEIQKLKNNKLTLETEISELETKYNSLGFFKSKEKGQIKNEITNRKINISKLNEKKKNLKEQCKIEIEKLDKQEKNELKEFKEKATDTTLKEQIDLTLSNLGIYDSDIDPKLEEVIEVVLSKEEVSTSFIQHKFNLGYARARKNIRPNGRKRYNF